MYSKDKIDKLQEYMRDIRVEELLEKWGGEPKGNKYACIFHEDLYPSLFVDSINNVFYCHSCQRGGSSAKLIHYYYKQNFNTKSYYDSLEKYLDRNSDVRKELGFTSLREDKTKINILDLKNIVDIMDDIELNRRSQVYCKKKYKPKRESKDMDAILKYVIRRQNKH